MTRIRWRHADALQVGTAEAMSFRISGGRSPAPVNCRISSTSSVPSPEGARRAQSMASSSDLTSMM